MMPMPGNLDIHESVIVMRDARAADEAAATLTPSRAGVLHRYGPRVIVRELSDAVREDLLSRFANTIVVDDAAELLSRSDLDLDETGRLGVQAVAQSQAEERAESTA